MKNSKRKYKYRILSTTAVLVVSFALTAFVLAGFSRSLCLKQTALGIDQLREVTEQNVHLVQNSVREKVDFIQAIASEISVLEDLKSDTAVSWLRKWCAGTDFERLAIDFASDGISHTSDGYVVDISDMGYADKIFDGETFITELLYAKIDGKPCISIIVPIVRNGQSTMAVRGTISTQTFGKVLEMNYFSGKGYFHLMDSNGEYMALPTTNEALLMDTNYFEAIKNLTFDKGYSADRLVSDVKAGISGNTAYSYMGEGRYVQYMPVSINDWILMVITPKEVIDINARIIQRDVLSLLIKLSFIALCVFGIILYSVKISRDEMQKINEELLVGEKRYRFMLKSSNNIVFEYTIASASIEYSDGFSDLFGYEPHVDHVPNSIIESNAIYPEDLQQLLSLSDNIKNGVPETKTELRMRSKSGNYIWCSVAASTIFDESGLPIKAIGVIENIHERKCREQMLTMKAERDQLTGLYNKATTEQAIKSFLNGTETANSIHALMILDVDDFKGVNDTLGHMYGDTVLKALAGTLKPILRDSDVVGRLGGDEFFVFMKNINCEETATRKAEEICTSFRKTYMEEGIDCDISASIGIALYPHHGTDFITLYQNADIALYAQKARGKDGYFVYDGNDEYNYSSSR